MKTKRKRSDDKRNYLFEGLIAYVVLVLLIAFILWLCAVSMYYQFDGVAPCTPESSVCLEVAK